MQNDNNKLSVRRGDGFDIGPLQDAEITSGQSAAGNALEQIIANPSQLSKLLGLEDEKMLRNVKSLFIGGGTGLLHNKLAPLFGDEVAAGISAVGVAWATRKILESLKK